MRSMRLVTSVLCVLAFTAQAETRTPAPKPSATPSAEAVRELRWEELIPAGYRPDNIFKKFARRAAKLKDDDPRAKELQQELLTAWNEAPVVAAFDGKTVKLPGYVVPLEGDSKNVKEFLLVPYFGACIHVPPPPSNQLVYVSTGKAGAKVYKLFDTVMVTGTLHTSGAATAHGSAGYTLDAIKVEAY